MQFRARLRCPSSTRASARVHRHRARHRRRAARGFPRALRWLMVRDADGEDYTEHHVPGTLEYRFRRSAAFRFRRSPPLRRISRAASRAEWERDGERGRGDRERPAHRAAERPARRSAGGGQGRRAGRLELAVTCARAQDGSLIGYAVTDERHTYFRWLGERLELLDPEAPDAALEEAAFRFVDEWIWYDEEEAALGACAMRTTAFRCAART